MRPGGIFAVSVGLSAVPPALAVEMSAGPSSRPRSDGLSGEAKTRMTTSSAAGSGNRRVMQRELQLTAGGDQGSQLQIGLAHWSIPRMSNLSAQVTPRHAAEALAVEGCATCTDRRRKVARAEECGRRKQNDLKGA